MFYYRSFEIARNTVLFFLLTLSFIVQAESPEDSTTNHGRYAAADANEMQRFYDFPAWPERVRVRREIIPPAPPGPYMSSALNDFSIEGPSFARKSRGLERPVDISDMPMDTFSRDASWPSNDKAPKRWIPKNGYHYVDQNAENAMYSNTPRRPVPGYGSGYYRNTNMNRPAGWMQ